MAPTIIQAALALEAAMNLPAIIGLTFFPVSTISPYTVPSPDSTLHGLNGLSTLLCRIIGGLIGALTPQLLLAYPETSEAPARRKMAYMTLGTGEVLLIPLLLWEAFRVNDAAKSLPGFDGSGFKNSIALASAGILTIPLIWRLWVWRCRPAWLGLGSMSSTRAKNGKDL